MPRPHHRRSAARLRSLLPTADSRQPTASPRSGLTVIEMLIATLITLVMMAAVVNLFANLSESIRNRRAVIELSSQIRHTRQQLVRDLAGCTVPLADRGLVPWQRPGEAIGYFEYVEGQRSDADPSRLVDGIYDVSDPNNLNLELDYQGSLVPSGGDPRTLLPRQDLNGRVALESDVTNGGALGDFDDILALTVRSEGDPFVGNCEVEVSPGNWETQRVESSLAEVIWYASENPADDPATPEDERVVDDPNTPQNEQLVGGQIREPGMRTIYRRVLLIAPWLTNINQHGGFLDAFHANNDVSAHFDSGAIVPNTLADVTRREYRYGRSRNSNFPHEFEPGRLSGDAKYLVLNDALAFDVRAFDPGAPLFEIAGVVVQPGDPGWDLAAPNVSANPPVGFGAYADLGYDGNGDYVAPAGAPLPLFQQERQAGWHPLYPNFGAPAVYDTWSWHYENDGVDQYGDNAIDIGTNGRDDDGVNGVDDPGERETWPPYNVPLRGVKVLLRIYERDARQVREASVTNSFVP